MKSGVHAINFVLRKLGAPVVCFWMSLLRQVINSYNICHRRNIMLEPSLMSACLAGFFSLSREQNHGSRSAPAGASNRALHIHNSAPMNIQAGMQTPLLTYLFSPASLFVPPLPPLALHSPLSSFLS